MSVCYDIAIYDRLTITLDTDAHVGAEEAKPGKASFPGGN